MSSFLVGESDELLIKSLRARRVIFRITKSGGVQSEKVLNMRKTVQG